MRLSIVVPILDEHETIPELRAQLGSVVSAFEAAGHSVEVIVNDNKSTDGSSDLLSDWAREDSHVIHNRFDQRLSFQQSIVHGFRAASGDCLTVLQGDLQDPPHLILSFFDSWLAGNKVVVGLAKNRHSTFVNSLSRAVFYRVLSASLRGRGFRGFQDFYLLDREVYESLADRPNHFQFIRGALAADFGVDSVVVYNRDFRQKGRSKFRFAEKYDLAMDALLVHSETFSRYLSVFGLITALLSGLAVVGSALAFFFGVDFGAPGWLSLFSLLALVLGLVAFFSALHFEYLRRLLVLGMMGGDR